MKIDGLEEVTETMVSGGVQLDRVHLQHEGVEHIDLSLMFQVIHTAVKPLER